MYRAHAGYEVLLHFDPLSQVDRVFSLSRPPLNYLLLHDLNDHRFKGEIDENRLLILSGEPLNLNEIGPDDLLVVDRALLDTPRFRPTFDAAMGRMSSTIYGPIDPDIVTLLDDYHGANLFRDFAVIFSSIIESSLFRQRRPTKVDSAD